MDRAIFLLQVLTFISWQLIGGVEPTSMAAAFEDVLACREGDLPVTVTVAVLPIPVEGFEMTLDDLQSLIDEDVVAHGAALCVGRALASDGPLPSHLRFDVVSVCVNLDAGRVRVHHVRGAWQS